MPVTKDGSEHCKNCVPVCCFARNWSRLGNQCSQMRCARFGLCIRPFRGWEPLIQTVKRLSRCTCMWTSVQSWVDGCSWMSIPVQMRQFSAQTGSVNVGNYTGTGGVIHLVSCLPVACSLKAMLSRYFAVSSIVSVFLLSVRWALFLVDKKGWIILFFALNHEINLLTRVLWIRFHSNPFVRAHCGYFTGMMESKKKYIVIKKATL